MISRVIIRVIVNITYIRGLITPLRTIHEPPSTLIPPLQLFDQNKHEANTQFHTAQGLQVEEVATEPASKVSDVWIVL